MDENVAKGIKAKQEKVLIENNKLIAEFMEVDQVDIDSHIEEEGDLKYHELNSWLEPVVQKIKDLGYKVELHYNGLHKHYKAKIKRPDNGLDLPWFAEKIIDCLYPAVVEFIKWYNKNK